MSLKVSASQSHKKIKEGELSAASLASFNPDNSSADEIKAKLRAWHSRVKTGKVKDTEDPTHTNQDTQSCKVTHATSHQAFTPLANIPLPQPSPSLLGAPTVLSSAAVLPQNMSQMLNEQLVVNKKAFPDTPYGSADFTGPLSLSEILRRKKRTQKTDQRQTAPSFATSKPPTPFLQPVTSPCEGTLQDLAKRQMTSSEGHYVTLSANPRTTPAAQDPCGVTSLENTLPTTSLDHCPPSLHNSFSVHTSLPENFIDDLPNSISVQSTKLSESQTSLESTSEPRPTKEDQVITDQTQTSIDSHQSFTPQFPSAPREQYMENDSMHEPFLTPSDVPTSHADPSHQTLPPVPISMETSMETFVEEQTFQVQSHGAPSSSVDQLESCEPFFMSPHHEMMPPVCDGVITSETPIRSSSSELLSTASHPVPQLNEEKETNSILQKQTSSPISSSCHQNPEIPTETLPSTFHNSDVSCCVDASKNHPTPQIQNLLHHESLAHPDNTSSKDNASIQSTVLESLDSDYSSLHPSVKSFLHLAGPETFTNYLYIMKCIAKQTTPEQFHWIQKALNQETPQQDSHTSESSPKKNIPLSVGRSILKILLSTIKDCAFHPPHNISSTTPNLNDPKTDTTSSDSLEDSTSVS